LHHKVDLIPRQERHIDSFANLGSIGQEVPLNVAGRHDIVAAFLARAPSPERQQRVCDLKNFENSKIQNERILPGAWFKKST
jgi:hypothetical protein